MTFNLMSLLQERLGARGYQTLGTLRTRLLAVGAVAGRSGRQSVVRLLLVGPWRERFERALAGFFPSVDLNSGAVGTG